MKKIIIYICVMLLLVFTGCSKDPDIILENKKADELEVQADQEDDTSENTTEHKSNIDLAKVPSDDTGEIFVYVCGAVETPGVYQLEEGDRIFDAIDMAGGLKDDALEGYINLAQRVSDGQMIRIPTVDEKDSLEQTPEQAVGGPSSNTSSGKININTASVDELMTLSGIGEAKAKMIVEYRESHGGFSSISELMNIDGIKEGTYSKIMNDIEV